MKISLISVAPPYRGGISEQTHLLYKELKKHHSVNIINFKRQYPEILFPGKSQYHDSCVWDEEYNHRFKQLNNQRLSRFKCPSKRHYRVQGY